MRFVVFPLRRTGGYVPDAGLAALSAGAVAFARLSEGTAGLAVLSVGAAVRMGFLLGAEEGLDALSPGTVEGLEDLLAGSAEGLVALSVGTGEGLLVLSTGAGAGVSVTGAVSEKRSASSSLSKKSSVSLIRTGC